MEAAERFELPFSVWDAEVDHLGSPDEEGPAGLRPGVHVWSFAPEGLTDVRSGPAHHALLACTRRLAGHLGVPVREAGVRLIALASTGGEPTTVIVGGSPAPGMMFEIVGLGWVVSSVTAAHALAASCYLTPAVLEYRLVTASPD